MQRKCWFSLEISSMPGKHTFQSSFIHHFASTIYIKIRTVTRLTAVRNCQLFMQRQIAFDEKHSTKIFENAFESLSCFRSSFIWLFTWKPNARYGQLIITHAELWKFWINLKPLHRKYCFESAHLTCLSVNRSTCSRKYFQTSKLFSSIAGMKIKLQAACCWVTRGFFDRALHRRRYLMTGEIFSRIARDCGSLRNTSQLPK